MSGLFPAEHPLIQRLAAVEHERWAKWQAYLHVLCDQNKDGSLTIPANLVARWERQIGTSYADLPEHEKASDVREAETTLRAIVEAGYVVVEANGPAAFSP